MEATASNNTSHSRAEQSLMPEDNALIQLVKSEVISSRSQMAETIKTEMASFHSEIGLIVESHHSDFQSKFIATLSLML